MRFKIKKKEDKRLRGTDGTGLTQQVSMKTFYSYATFSVVVILRPVLVRFYRTGEETAFERHRSGMECSSIMNKNNCFKQMINHRIYVLNLSSWEKKKKTEKKSDLDGIRTHDLWNTGWAF